MEKSFIFDNLIFILLFIANKKLEDYNTYFKLIYIILIIHNIYFLIYIIIEFISKDQYKIVFSVLISLFLYYFSYYYICDSNPNFYLVVYYLFYPNFFKAILIVFIHTFIVSKVFICCQYKFLESSINCNDISFSKVAISIQKNEDNPPTRKKNYYFLSFYTNYFLNNKRNFIIFILSLIIIIALEVFVFMNRIKFWVHRYNKNITLPIATAKNTTFFIAATVHNMEKIIDDYFIEMKKLINYLGKENIIISIMENGDSTDKTREKLYEFMEYLNETEIVNRIIIDHEIDDPRKNESDPYSLENNFLSNLRIKYYSELRNRCLDFIYEIPNLNFSNTKVIFFNDIIFEYENIINLLGYSLRHDFPFFVNKEGQDLVINHKPVRVMSCWNGVIVFTAEPLKDRKIKFRYELEENREIQYYINSDQQYNYESECTYFHIDLHSLGYTKKFINPEVRVAYEYKYYYLQKMYYPNEKEHNMYKQMYEESKLMKRNKDMSNYKDRNLTLKGNLYKWYESNKLKHNKHK